MNHIVGMEVLQAAGHVQQTHKDGSHVRLAALAAEEPAGLDGFC